jgi:hypothetical protein
MSATTDSTTQTATPAGPAVAPGKAIVKIEGQEVPLAERIASDDTLLKKALRRYYTSINNANITRKREGGVLIVTVVKRADFKGRGERRRSPSRSLAPYERVLEALRLADEHTNPALLLARDLQTRLARGRISHASIARMDEQIERVMGLGSKEVESTRNTIRRIRECRPAATAATPEGF